MSEEQHKLNEILQEKFSSKDFSFDEENWEKVEIKIDREREKKKRRRVILIFLLGLVAGMAIMIPFVRTGSLQDQKTLSEMNDTQSKKGPAPVTKNGTENGSNEQLSQNDHSGTSQKNNVVVLNEKDHSGDQTSYKQDPVYLAPDAQNKKSGTTNHVIVISADTRNDGSTTVKNDQEIKENEPVLIVTKTDTSATLKDHIMKDPIAITIPKKDSSTTLITQVIAKDTLPVKTKTDPSPGPDTVGNSSAPVMPDQNLNSSTVFSIDAGADYDLGWHYADTAEGNGLDPVFGFGIAHYFNTHWAIASGLHYNRISQLSSQKIFTTNTLGFGKTTIDSIIDTKWLHYIVMPVFVHYLVNDRNSIAIGGTLGHLVTTTSNFITSVSTDFGDPVQTKKQSPGYTKGFAPWSASVGLMYRRRISNKFSISAEGFFGLSDIKDDVFFAKDKFERSSGIKVLITYDLFKK